MTSRNAIVFDDDELFCYLFTRLFREKNINVSTYESPSLYICSQPGVDSCPVDSPCTDFLLTDQLMDGMTGLEFLMKIKQMGCKIPDCRKAIISGDWTEEALSQAKQVVAHVFDKSEAKECIARWVEESGE